MALKPGHCPQCTDPECKGPSPLFFCPECGYQGINATHRSEGNVKKDWCKRVAMELPFRMIHK